MRKRHFQIQPLCVACLERGRTTVATELDHIVALVNGGTNDPENFAGLCRWCHIKKTRIDMGWKPKPKVGVDGWPEDFA
jgi:5-methylcytosine-specific restriction protein A